MKKAIRSLVLRRETLRTLISVDLSRAAGGVESGTQSGVSQCTVKLAGDSGDFQCPKMLASGTQSGDVQCPNRS